MIKHFWELDSRTLYDLQAGCNADVSQKSYRGINKDYRKFQHSTRSDRIGYAGVRGNNDDSKRKMKITVNWDVMLCYFQVRTSNV